MEYSNLILYYMKHLFISLSYILCLFLSCGQIEYPITEKKIVTDTYFDIEVEDPYRWLENDNSPQVKEWIRAQNELTYSYSVIIMGSLLEISCIMDCCKEVR